MPERRLKAVLVPESEVMREVIRALPVGAELIGVHHDFQRGAFLFVLRSPLFDEVPEGLRMDEIRRDQL